MKTRDSSNDLFSPDFETVPFGIEATVAGKRVFQASSFSDIDHKVDRICAPFNMIVTRKGAKRGDVLRRPPITSFEAAD